MTKVNFFKRIWLAITDFRIYPYSQKEKTRTAIWFIIKLLFVCSMIIAVFFTKEVFDTLPSLIAKTNEIVPEFSIINGSLDAEKESFAEINSDTYLVFSNKYKSDDILNLVNKIKDDENITKNYKGYVFILGDQTSFVYDLEGALYQAVKIDYSSDINTDKDTIVKEFTSIEDSFVSKLIVFSFFVFVFYIVMIINRLTTSIIYFITIFLLNTIFALKLKFKDYIRIICYVSTLPIILETIAIIATKQISGSINLICTLISFVYMFYGLRAIKIDNILTNGTGKNPLEKLENAIKEAQDEIEEQLKEKTEDNEKDKTNESKNENKELDNDENDNDKE